MSSSIYPDPASGFGEDTLIQKANAAAALKTIWEGIAAYTSNVAGAEASAYTVKVLQAGAQVAAQVIAGQGTLFPTGFYDGTPGNTRSGAAVGDVGTGMSKFQGGHLLAFDVEGTRYVYIGNFSSTPTIEIEGTFAQLTLNNDCRVARSVDATSSQSNLQLVGKFGGGVTDVVIGPDGVLANNAAGGILQMPTCTGVPTGAPRLNVGKFGWMIGNTAVAKRLYTWDGATWTAGPLL